MSKDFGILESIAEEFKNNFTTIRESHYNPNTKGYDYEKIVKEFFEKYLGNFFEFHERIPVYDAKLECKTFFTDEENELDVVAIYKTALPRIISTIRERNIIAYDAIAFLIEVKQTLTKSNLKKDLEKLRRLSLFKLGQNVYIPFRLGQDVYLPPLRTQYSLGRPLRILFYFERKMNEKLLWETLNKSEDWYDFLVISDENKLLLNRHLPITKDIVSRLKEPLGRSFLEQSHALSKLLYFLTMTVQYPILVNAWGIFETFFSK